MLNLSKDEKNMILQQLKKYKKDLEISLKNESDYDSIQEDKTELEIVTSTIIKILGE